jgi:AraC-like DNA-binding protein
MKPVPAFISPESIFFIREVKQVNFSSELHFHEECQLAYIIKGSGKRIVGDSVEHFDEHELVFIGSNIPHVWYNTDIRFPKTKKLHSVSLSLFISPERFLDHMKDFGEVERIKQLFRKAQRGMFITGKTKLKLIGLLKKAADENNSIKHTIILLEIIYILCTTEEYMLLASNGYVNYFQYSENERMNAIYKFLMKNFNRDISLAEVAGLAAMNPNAFCRFFKSRTQKTLTQFINEIRIGHACKLLANEDKSIEHIAYECGYNNVSNFNHFFKLIKKTSPRGYKKELEIK